jgi:SAM-dependent methyltransferase
VSGASERLFAQLNVPMSGTIALFGAHSDILIPSFAQRVGVRGLVYSVELTDAVESPDRAIIRTRRRPAPDVVRVQQKENGRVPLPDETLDLALWVFALGTLSHVGNMLSETRRVLRPGGRLAVLDWVRQDESVGPARDERVAAATCERCLASAGFGLIAQRAVTVSHYLVIGRRPFGEAGQARWSHNPVAARSPMYAMDRDAR